MGHRTSSGGPLGPGAALGHHQRPDRLHRAVPALGRARRPAGLRGPRGADCIQRIGLALAAAVLPVRPVHLHHLDTRGGHVPGQASAVTAGPLDAGQRDRPEPGQPAQQAGVTGCGGWELLRAEQSPDGIQRRGHMHVGMGVHAAGDGACLYDGHVIPFLWLRDGTHPLAAGPVNPGLLHRTGRSGRRRRWVPQNLGPGRQIDSQDSRSVSRFAGQAGPRPGPTPRPPQNHGSRAGGTKPILPASCARRLAVEVVVTL